MPFARPTTNGLQPWSRHRRVLRLRDWHAAVVKARAKCGHSKPALTGFHGHQEKCAGRGEHHGIILALVEAKLPRKRRATDHMETLRRLSVTGSYGDLIILAA